MIEILGLLNAGWTNAQGKQLPVAFGLKVPGSLIYIVLVVCS